MKKQLICVDNLDDFICRADGALYVDQQRLLSPGARDELARRRVKIIYGPEPVQKEAESATEVAPAMPRCHACCGTGKVFYVGMENSGKESGQTLDNLVIALSSMLRNEYGVTDEEELRNKTVAALKTIKENL